MSERGRRESLGRYGYHPQESDKIAETTNDNSPTCVVVRYYDEANDRIREVAASIDRDSDGNFIRGGSSDGAQLGVVIDVEEWSATNQIDDEGLSFLVPVYNDTDALILGLTFLLMRNGAKSEEISDIVDRIIA